MPDAMRKNNKSKKLNLDTETVRSLQESALVDVAGGYNSEIICPKTVVYTCKVQTPSCPI